MRIKRLMLIFITVLLCAFLLFSFFSKPVKLNEEKSYFSDFYVEDGKVYFYCELVVDSSRTCDAEIIGNFEREQDKLLKEATVVGYDKETGSNTFHIEKGSNRISVVFVGAQGNTDKKLDRLLPDEIEIILK